MPRSLVIDVRSPEEYSTGYLPGAINIEYTSISNLPILQPSVSKQDSITLYCRSGRRSAIALNILNDLGFEHVRDIGAYEAAEQILLTEATTTVTGIAPSSELDLTASSAPPTEQTKHTKQALEMASQRLLDGLKGLE